jgi:hypothetical protein
MIDQLCKQIGLDKVMESVCPERADTLKALVAFRLTNPDNAWNIAEEWYRKSYARILYPKAIMQSPRISEFHALIGTEENYHSFFNSYLRTITNCDNISEQISIPILIDSTGLENCIKTHLTAVNNHHGTVKNEIRLIYVVDKNTKLPIFFRYVPGNVIDNSTLITSINELAAFGLNIELIIMDAGYCSQQNLEQLSTHNIPFLTRMTKNRKEYKYLMTEHSGDLLQQANLVRYHHRRLCAKMVPISIYGTELYAYIMLDLGEISNDLLKAADKFVDSSDCEKKTEEGFFSAGKFILLSSVNYNTDEILPLYYSRQAIEQVFDFAKSYGGTLPLRGHSEETIRGILLISFIATAVYSCLSHSLAESRYSPHSALLYMHNASIKIYESVTLLEELTKQHKEIFSHLKLECPFSELESGNLLQKYPLQAPAGRKKGNRGRPKGSKNKPKHAFADFEQNQAVGERRPRGRPKGSKNKPKHAFADFEQNQAVGERRPGGRLKGTKTKRT